MKSLRVMGMAAMVAMIAGFGEAARADSADQAAAVIKFLEDFFDETDKAVASLRTGKSPTRTEFGEAITARLDSATKQIETMEPLKCDHPQSEIPLATLMSMTPTEREPGLETSRKYVDGKKTEVNQSRAALTRLDLVATRADKMAEGMLGVLAALTKISFMDEATEQLVEQAVYDIEVNVVPGCSELASTIRSKSRQLTEAIEQADAKMQTLSSALDILQAETSAEKDRIARTDELERTRRLLRTAMDAHARLVGQVESEGGDLDAEYDYLNNEGRAIDAMRYTLCPNHQSFERCDHSALKARWLQEKNNRKARLEQRAAAYAERLESFNTLEERCNRESDEISERSADLEQERAALQAESSTGARKMKDAVSRIQTL